MSSINDKNVIIFAFSDGPRDARKRLFAEGTVGILPRGKCHELWQ